MAAITRLIVAVLVTAAAFLSTASALSADTTVYYLKKGEGLSDVARKYNVPLGTIVRLNRSRLPSAGNPDHVYTGMAVIVPVKSAPAKPEAARPEASKPAAPKPPAKPVPAAPKASAKPAPKPTPPPAAQAEKPASAIVPKAEAPASESAKKPVSKENNSHAAKPTARPGNENSALKPDSDPEAIFPPGKTVRNMSEEARRRFQAAADGKWGVAELIVVAMLAVSIALLTWIALLIRRRLPSSDVADAGNLVLLAARDLGKNTRFFWFRASEKDVFVVTGAEAQVIAANSEMQPAPPIEQTPPAAAPTTTTAARRPRKTAGVPPASTADVSAAPPVEENR